MGRIVYALTFMLICVPAISLWNGLYAFAASLVHGVSISINQIIE